MKKLTILAALAFAAAPAFAEQTVQSDPFVSTQAAPAGVFGLGAGAAIVPIAAIAVAVTVATVDSQDSSTTTLDQ